MFVSFYWKMRPPSTGCNPSNLASIPKDISVGLLHPPDNVEACLVMLAGPPQPHLDFTERLTQLKDLMALFLLLSQSFNQSLLAIPFLPTAWISRPQ